MIIGTDLQLGARDQAIYRIDEETNEIIGRFPVTEIGEALCNFYFTSQAEKIVLSGPMAISRAVEEDIFLAAKAKYNNQDIKVELI